MDCGFSNSGQREIAYCKISNICARDHLTPPPEHAPCLLLSVLFDETESIKKKNRGFKWSEVSHKPMMNFVLAGNFSSSFQWIKGIQKLFGISMLTSSTLFCCIRDDWVLLT
jgi:hypothetical protein